MFISIDFCQLVIVFITRIIKWRVTKLYGSDQMTQDEVEQDEVFWNQDTLKDVGAVFPFLTTY
jgi:hypothetical protein